MSKTGRENHRRGTRGRPRAERVIRVRGVQRTPPDLRKLSRAVIALAMAEAEHAGQLQAEPGESDESSERARPSVQKPDTTNEISERGSRQ